MEGKFAIIVTAFATCRFLSDEEGETVYFETVSDCENWIEKNERTAHDYTIWDCNDASVLE